MKKWTDTDLRTAFEDGCKFLNFKDLKDFLGKRKELETSKQQALNIGVVMPRFCFSCGHELDKIELNSYQCKNERCAEVIFCYAKDIGLVITYVKTPFSPPHEA